MRAVLATLLLLISVASAAAEESQIRIGAIDAFLTVPSNIDKPPVALLIAGSGSTDHDGNGPQTKPATLKKLSDGLVAQGIATLRYDKRGAGGWKKEFG
ncbi:MAG: alpha/beta hydrolase family protein, partial [Bradyrhizobium sp.]